MASYNGYERDIFSISLIVDDRLWFHFVIQTGDLPSFLQILQIPMSSLLARASQRLWVASVYQAFFVLNLNYFPQGWRVTRGEMCVQEGLFKMRLCNKDRFFLESCAFVYNRV